MMAFTPKVPFQPSWICASFRPCSHPRCRSRCARSVEGVGEQRAAHEFPAAPSGVILVPEIALCRDMAGHFAENEINRIGRQST